MSHSITVFGASITFGTGDTLDRGWCGRLKKYFEDKGYHHKLYNLGIGGNTTEDLLERFDAEARARVKFKHEGDRHVIICSIGINDSKIIKKENMPAVELDVFKNNIQLLINKARSFTEELVFIGLMPVDESLTSNYEETLFTNERIGQFDNVVKELCQSNGVPFFDIFDKFSKLNYQKLLSDGLHPNSEGYQKMYELIKHFLIENKIIE